MVAGQSVGVLNDPLLADIYENGLTTHGTDIVREVLGWHARCTVILKKKKKGKKNENVGLNTHKSLDAREETYRF